MLLRSARLPVRSPPLLNSASAAASILGVIVLLLLLSAHCRAAGRPEANVLIDFKNSLDNPLALSSWVATTPPCNGSLHNWVGLICINNIIWGIRLENMGLAGPVDIQALVNLPTLRAISLQNNNFEGDMPDIRKLGALKALFLSNNRFDGTIPDDAFLGMTSLKKVVLANNAFSGDIPSSLTKLPKLFLLRMEGNQFTGKIPPFAQIRLQFVDFANNELDGPIPAIFAHLPPSSFAGNKNLCGAPLSTPPCPTPPHFWNPWLAVNIVLIIIIIVGIILMVCLVGCCCARRMKQREEESGSGRPLRVEHIRPVAAHHVPARTPSANRRHQTPDSKLIFLREDIERFGIQDMLRASAEVLGSGAFGASYKAVINSGLSLVVKRYKQMNNVGREDFHEHMRRMGKLHHPNLQPLLAYYYRKEEKLLVTQFAVNTSLASHLHAHNTLNQPSLEWRIRLKIIKGVVRGLTYLYSELPSLVVPHGHLKSSNVLLDDSYEPLLTDYALRPVANQEQAHKLMIAYKSPEYTQLGRITKKTDVWCLGILILEILTGKFPENYLTHGYDSRASLPSWVHSMVQEKRTGEVFDKEMKGTEDNKSQMFGVLKIGLCCCEEDWEVRPQLEEVAADIQRVEDDDDDDISSTVAELNGIN